MEKVPLRLRSVDEQERVHVVNGANEFFFLIAFELRKLGEARILLENTQQKQTELMQDQFEVLENNMNLGRNSDEFLFTEIQAEHYIEGINVAVVIFPASSKISRAAFSSEKANL